LRVLLKNTILIKKEKNVLHAYARQSCPNRRVLKKKLSKSSSYQRARHGGMQSRIIFDSLNNLRAIIQISGNFWVLRGVSVSGRSTVGRVMRCILICMILSYNILRLCFLSTSCKGSRHFHFVHAYLDLPPLTSIPP
jgi:mRNA-degrading endonuclease RelE of RelBE toxin-antitoxin system